jgi:hypothetical protein
MVVQAIVTTVAVMALTPKWGDGEPFLVSSRTSARWLLIVMICLASGVLGTWSQSIVFSRGAALTTARTFITSLIRSRQGLLIAFAAVGSVLMTVYIVMQNPNVPTEWIVVQALIVAAAIAYALVPPVALVCVPSVPTAVEILEAVSRQLFPNRVVALVNQRKVSDGSFWRNGHGNLRMLGSKTWQPVVRELLGSVQLVVIDCRVVTRPMIEEARWILNTPAVRRRTIFVGNAFGEAPLIREVNKQAPSGGVTVTSPIALGF